MLQTKSILLTLIQFSSLLYLLMVFPVFTGKITLLIIQLSGLLLGIWSIFVMSKSKLNITPVPRLGATLINIGPYRFVRHPMYVSLLLVLVPMMIFQSSVTGWIVFGIFLINLILKLSYEEQLLKQTFENYSKYQRHTWKLIPWIF